MHIYIATEPIRQLMFSMLLLRLAEGPERERKASRSQFRMQYFEQ